VSTACVIADEHYAEAGPCNVLFVPGGSGARIAMEDSCIT
jgi:hypothetical protein